MDRDWDKDLGKFEEFLKKIDLQKYKPLREIKTVEQDLPKDLLPLEIYYKYYWETTDFKDFDEVFQIYWKEKLDPHIYNFIKKYFYGCSLEFVEEGFKARLYRIWMSVLTQFHFQYLWNVLFAEKLISTPELDNVGIDAIVELGNKKIAIQIKKVSYRREASERRFTKRQQKYADVFVEVPYLVIDIDKVKSEINKLEKSKTKSGKSENRKEKLENILKLFNENFDRLENGFVIFKKEYLMHIRNVIAEKLKTNKNISIITYNEILPL